MLKSFITDSKPRPKQFSFISLLTWDPVNFHSYFICLSFKVIIHLKLNIYWLLCLVKTFIWHKKCYLWQNFQVGLFHTMKLSSKISHKATVWYLNLVWTQVWTTFMFFFCSLTAPCPHPLSLYRRKQFGHFAKHLLWCFKGLEQHKWE